MRANFAALALLTLLAFTPGVAAATISLDVQDHASIMARGERQEILVEAFAVDVREDTLLLARVDVGAPWNADITPAQIVIGAGDTRVFQVNLTSPMQAADDAVVRVSITLVEGTQSSVQEVNIPIEWVPAGLVMGRWENPLPEPLDGVWGVFLLTVLAWIAIGVLAALFLNPFVKIAARRTETELDDRIVKIVTLPTFILITVFGIKQALESFSLPAWFFSILDVVWGVVLAASLTYIVYRIWKEVILEVGRRVSAKTENELDDVLFPVFEKIGSVLILLGGLFYIVNSFGVNMAYFAAGGAAASLVIAFAAQDTLGNFFAGIFILMDRPFQVGHRVEIPEENTWGNVVDIGLRSTRIQTLDNRTIIVPNSLIGNNRVINHSYPNSTYRLQTHVGVAYGSDVERARKTLIDATSEVDGLVPGKPIDALFLEMADSALVFRVRWWINSYEDTRRHIDKVTTALEAALRREGIEVPFPQRTVWLNQQ